MGPSGFYLNEIGRVKPHFDIIDSDSQKELYENRTLICNSCENYIIKGSRCKLCGCSLEIRRKMIFPIDEDGKAFDYQFRGNRRYVCKLKKW